MFCQIPVWAFNKQGVFLHYKGNKFSLFFNSSILLGICLNIKDQ